MRQTVNKDMLLRHEKRCATQVLLTEHFLVELTFYISLHTKSVGWNS